MLHRTTDLQTTSSSTCARVAPSGRAAFVRNRAGKRRAALCEALFAFVMLLFLSAPAQAWDSGPVRVGILETVGRLTSAETFLPTINYLRKELALEGAELVVTYHDIESMRAALSNRELDFFISNSGFFAVAQQTFGARHLATQRPREADDPNAAMGGVFLVRAERGDLRTLEDLKGKRAVAVAPNGFGGYYVGLGEIEEAVRDRGLNKWKPESFFGEVLFTGYPMQLVLAELQRNPAVDVGLVRTCLLEEATVRGLVKPGEFRVINEKPATPGFRCRRSTALYPGWVFATTSRASAEASKRVAAVLLSMPIDKEGAEWSIASDFLSVDRLYRTLEVGHYAYLRHFDAARFIKAYWPHVLLLVVLILGGIVHAVKVERVVRERTASLEAALAEQRHLETEARVARERLDQMQKVGMLSMLSNMVAHELKQPLGVISNYIEGIRDWVRATRTEEVVRRSGLEGKPNEEPDWALLECALDEIEAQNRRAAEIIDHVRGYAKGEPRRVEGFSLRGFMTEAASTFRRLHGERCRLELDLTKISDDVRLEGSRMELELVLLNLLKNAAEAVRRESHPVVCLESGNPPDAKFADGIGICVRNRGTVSDEVLERVFEPKTAGRESGLGLGLAISAQIMEREGGALMLRRTTDGFVEAWMMLPKVR